MLRSSDGVGEILVDEATIRAEVARLGAQISADYAGRQPHLIGVLKGAAVFIADLARTLTVPATMDFISIVPYGHEVTSSGVVRIRKDLDDPIEGKDVLIVEDIIDSGRTLQFLKDRLALSRPRSVKVCALLDKKARREVEIDAEYLGKEIDDVFVVGYGIDFNETYRTLPEIYYVTPVDQDEEK